MNFPVLNILGSKPLLLKHSRNFLRSFLHASLEPDLDPAIERIGYICSCIGFFFGMFRLRAAKSDDYILQKVNEISLMQQPIKIPVLFKMGEQGAEEFTERFVFRMAAFCCPFLKKCMDICPQNIRWSYL